VLCSCVTAQYGSRLSSVTNVSRRCTNVVKAERVEDEYQHYDFCIVTSEQHTSVSGNNEDNADGGAAAALSLEDNLLLTDVMDVISCDAPESCDISTSSASSLPNCELTPNISRARTTAEHVSNEPINRVRISSVPVCSATASPTCHSNSENTAGKLPDALSRCVDRSNPLSTAFSAAQRLRNQPQKFS